MKNNLIVSVLEPACGRTVLRELRRRRSFARFQRRPLFAAHAFARKFNAPPLAAQLHVATLRAQFEKVPIQTSRARPEQSTEPKYSYYIWWSQWSTTASWQIFDHNFLCEFNQKVMTPKVARLMKKRYSPDSYFYTQSKDASTRLAQRLIGTNNLVLPAIEPTEPVAQELFKRNFASMVIYETNQTRQAKVAVSIANHDNARFNRKQSS